MKVYKKKDCTYEDGYILDKKGNTLAVDHVIVGKLNNLELLLQEKAYLNMQPEGRPAPSLEGFVFDDGLDDDGIEFVVDTPLLDEKVKAGVALAKEIDKATDFKEMQEIADQLEDVCSWCSKKKFFADKHGEPVRFRLSVLGNPLELKREDIAKAIAYIHGRAVEAEQVM